METENNIYTAVATAETEKVMSQFQTSVEQGLSQTIIKNRQQQYGFNELPTKQVGIFYMILRQCNSIFVYLFIIVALLSFFLGENANAIVMIIFIILNISISSYQEFRAKKTLNLLKQYLVSQVKVIRDGVEKKIPSNELVPGDIILLYPGDKVPADIRLVQADMMTVDESILTGESKPQTKNNRTMQQMPQEIFDVSNICFTGTMILTGKGKGIVFATGQDTVFGSIAKLTRQSFTDSVLVQGTKQLSAFILKLIVLTGFCMFMANIIIKGSHINIGELFIFCIALIVSAVPEALPLVVTFCLSRGASHLAAHDVIVKRLSAIEDMGAIEVLCADKTGTITENDLAVAQIYAKDPQKAVLYVAITTPTDSHVGKSFESASVKYLSSDVVPSLSQITILNEIPFDPNRKRHVLLVHHNNQKIMVVRGAPEVVLSLCHTIKDELALNAWIVQEGQQGRRVLAVATKVVPDQALDSLNNDQNLDFVGLISYIDPIKKSAQEAISKAQKLGLQIKIVSGDSPQACQAIAQQVDLLGDTHVILGDQFEKMSDHEKMMCVDENRVFARILPHQKHQIIQLLKRKYTVGYVGDGINDAPALQEAHVSLAIDTAIDIARESADIILLRKSLRTIVSGINEGRTILVNTMKYIKTTIASNIGNFFALAVASLFVDFLPMKPLHILLLNLITDFPLVAISTDHVTSFELKKPRRYNIKDTIFIITIFGIVSSIFDFICFVTFVRISMETLQTCWFIESVLTEIVFIYSMRTEQVFYKAKRPSLLLMGLSVLAAMVSIALPFSSFGIRVLGFHRVTVQYLLIVFIIVFSYFVTTEIVKYWYRKYMRTNS